MKKFTEVSVRVIYYVSANIMMESEPVLSGSDPYADDCYNDSWN